MSSTTTTPSAGITTDDQTNAAQRRAKGEFVRGVSSARHWITDEKDAMYPPAANRYHLIVAYNCPWCHRVLLGRNVAGLQDAITVDVCFPNRSSDEEPLGGNLWKFQPEGQETANGRFVTFPECTVDTVFGGKKYVKEIYEACGIMDQKSVPLLIDKDTKTVVSNESAEILRMFGTVMTPFSNHNQENAAVDLYPTALASEIDQVNDFVYTQIANGSYKAGFSSNQDAYEAAYDSFFDAMTVLEQRLDASDFLVGNTVTEADLRLFPPMFRFDAIYYLRMKLNKHYLWEYRNVWKWMGRMMRLDGMEEVANQSYLQHCKQGYFGRTGNGTVPKGPEGYPACMMEPHASHTTTAN